MMQVLLVDDHALFREGLKRLLEDVPDLAIAGEAATGTEALDLVRERDWGLVLLDISLPDLSGIEVLRLIHQEKPQCPVLMLSMYPAEDFAALAVHQGAAGYIGKDCSSEQLIEAMRRVAAGGRFVDPRLAHELFFDMARQGAPLHTVLSPRETQVMTALVGGHTIAEIAQQLNVNAKTVSTYRARLLNKLGLHNNAQLVRYAKEYRLMLP